ncbi:hypothetical protein JMJ77_0004195 [Colletotrichum scovillei]|uniref:Uncharacterized protein n=1 Tax=Colletotrichum scovillei TaxID=1209932 RepID=A0A9P7R004_9PEZI|nr:hypothetical protein JMJ77_0004195 [Colletotrichum scovillei]KAG7049481.1 hypothetical protein JMJ78_0013463 [Colletotrichum scovillei]KAG7064186.1 hypothetical protein JMJ76_0007234 [Colletotrichum scovillei]
MSHGSSFSSHCAVSANLAYPTDGFFLVFSALPSTDTRTMLQAKQLGNDGTQSKQQQHMGTRHTSSQVLG